MRLLLDLAALVGLANSASSFPRVASMANRISVAHSHRSAAQAAAAQNPHLRKIRDLIYQIAGILQPDHKLQFLEDRCGRRLHQLQIAVAARLLRLPDPEFGAR